VTARAVLDPETLETITTIYAASEIERDTDGPVRVTIADEWDGTDEAGQTLENPKAYPSELSVAVVRLYAGKGNGPYPSLRVGEFLTYEQMSEIMMQLPMRNVLIGWVRTDLMNPYSLLRYVLPPLYLKPEHNPLIHCARDCDEAAEACILTNLTSTETQTKVFCADCKLECQNHKPALWSGGPTGHGSTCNYYAKSLVADPTMFLPFEMKQSEAICFSPGLEYCPFNGTCEDLSNGYRKVLCWYDCDGDPVLRSYEVVGDENNLVSCPTTCQLPENMNRYFE